MNDYERVARVIEYVEEHYREQPDLACLAAVAGVSPHHFHRLFRRWAGTTPKAFVRYLTAMEAKRLLRDGSCVLDTALDVGLSGPGRLHDLCVSLEAASPGEIRSGGEGWTITGGFCGTPFGEALVAEGPRGICRLVFPHDAASRATEWVQLQAEWPRAALRRDDRAVSALTDGMFAKGTGSASPDPIRVCAKGSAFQQRVWRALVEIPFGEVWSYGRLAGAAGVPRSARAVGTAVGRNPVSVLIPCHRVIRASGAIGNYRWGATRKRGILAWERAGCEEG